MPDDELSLTDNEKSTLKQLASERQQLLQANYDIDIQKQITLQQLTQNTMMHHHTLTSIQKRLGIVENAKLSVNADKGTVVVNE